MSYDPECDDDGCRCHGGRLIVIIGKATDPSIGGALNWAKSVKAGSPLYSLAFESPGAYMTPKTLAGGQWVAAPKSTSESATAQKIRASWDKCCYFNEVLVIGHGHQVHFADLSHFARLYFDRPIERLILWICAGDRDTFPFTSYRAEFAKFCALVRPCAVCPCGCQHAICQSTSADGKPEKCPVGPTAATHILSAGYYSSGGHDYPSKLGLNPANAANPFEAPDNRLIDTTVTTNGAGTQVDWSPQATVGGNVFDSLGVTKPANPPTPSGLPFSPQAKLVPEKVGLPAKGQDRPSYQGPTTAKSGCSPVGCLPILNCSHTLACLSVSPLT